MDKVGIMNASHLYIQSGFTCTKMNFPAYNIHGMKTRLQMVYSVIEYSDFTEASFTFKIYRNFLCQISPDWDNKCGKIWIENHLHY